MKFNNIKKDDIVQICSNNEWNGLFGTVKEIIDDIAYIFCVQNPCYLYKIHKGYNENELKLVNF